MQDCAVRYRSETGGWRQPEGGPRKAYVLCRAVGTPFEPEKPVNPGLSPQAAFGIVDMVIVGVLVSMLGLLSIPSVSAFPDRHERVTASASLRP